MDYYEGLIKNTEFFTTAELAKKLKMNVQVITRKVQAGEISAFKIGKDWRIPEQSVYEWLQRQSNSSGGNGSSAPTTEKTANSTGRRMTARRGPEDPPPKPATRPHSERKYLLEYILAQFEPNRKYSQDEVDRIIGRYHSDLGTVRRELVGEGMMEQVDNSYQRRPGYRVAD